MPTQNNSVLEEAGRPRMHKQTGLVMQTGSRSQNEDTHRKPHLLDLDIGASRMLNREFTALTLLMLLQSLPLNSLRMPVRETAKTIIVIPAVSFHPLVSSCAMHKSSPSACWMCYHPSQLGGNLKGVPSLMFLPFGNNLLHISLTSSAGPSDKVQIAIWPPTPYPR